MVWFNISFFSSYECVEAELIDVDKQFETSRQFVEKRVTLVKFSAVFCSQRQLIEQCCLCEQGNSLLYFVGLSL